MNDRSLDVAVSALGRQGDGIAGTEDGRLFIPYAAPGDVLRVQLPHKRAKTMRVDIVEVLTAGPDRQDPVCAHFSHCGGCAVQHVRASAYTGWKRSLVCDALARRGIDASVVQDVVPGDVGRRRRTRLHARLTATGIILGYLSARSHHIVAVTECPVLVPEIVAILDPLRLLLARSMTHGQEAVVSVTRCKNGLDMTLALGESLTLEDRERIVSFANKNDLARLSWCSLVRGKSGETETVIRRSPSTINYAGIDVEIPPDAFVQPTAEGETVLRHAVLSTVSGATRVVDLFAGCGSFSLPIAASGSHVLAVDSCANQLTALDLGARRANLGEFVRTQVRDLNRQPLMDPDLADYEAVILDPPRAGAMIQAKILADSPVAAIVYVSCNPASFARDARALIDGGYDLQTLLPVDQFLFSSHIELVATFRKDV